MIEAVVQTGSFETTYHRAGSGTPVLLLGDGRGPLSDWLFLSLAAHFRTIAAVLPDEVRAGAEAARLMEEWLRGLIDGLGVERPGVVAGSAHAGALLRFAALDPHRLDRLVLIRTPEAGPCPGPGPEEGLRAPHPFLLLAVPLLEETDALAAARDELIGFLGRCR